MAHAYRTPEKRDELADPTGPADLGRVISEHRTDLLFWQAGLALHVLFAIVVLLVTADTFRLVLLAIGSVTALLWTAIMLLPAPRSIIVHREGLKRERWLGEPDVLLFEECAAVYYDYTVIRLFGVTNDLTFRLVATDGTTIQIASDVSDARELYEAVVRHCVRPVAAEARRAFREGEVLSFGPIAISKDSLTLQDQSRPWSDIREIEVSPRGLGLHFVTRPKSTWVDLRKLPYALVLIELLETTGCKLDFIEGFIAPHLREG